MIVKGGVFILARDILGFMDIGAAIYVLKMNH